MLPLSSSLSARGAEDSNTSLRASTRTASPAHVVLSPSEAPGLAAASSSSSFLPSKAVDALSVSELRAGMEQFLRSSGALGSLKTQLRSVIVSELLKRKRPAQKGGTTGGRGCDVSNKEKESPGDGSKSEEEEEEDLEDDGWTQRLSDALVESHLRHTGRSFSLAIFSSEADVSFGSSGDDALAGLLHLNSSVRSRRKVSLLQLILETHLQRVGDAHGRPPGYAVGTQTDNGDSEPSSQPSLELRLAAVDAKYALCFSRLRESTREEVDRRMAAYREELQMQMEQAYQQKLRVFEQQQLNEARRAAEDHYGILLQHKMEEMRELERVNVQRIEAERARLGQARDDLELQRAELDRRYRDLHGLLEERDKAVAAMEGRLHDAKQQIRVLTTQARQYEELCGVRLAETDAARDREWRRVEDMRRLEAEHLAELQLKEEEMSRLRFRLKSILAAHGVTDWRGEGGEEKEKEREKAAHIKEALMRANAFQERVSAAYYAPPPPPAAAVADQQQQQQQEEKELSGLRGLQSRETKWCSAWKLTEPTPPRSAEPKPVNGGGTAPEDPMMPPSVTSSVVVKEEEQQEDDQKNKKREVKDRHTLLASSSSFTPTSSVAKPLKMNTDSTELHNLPPDSKVAPSETSGGAIINREQEEEKRRSSANNERERSQSGDDNKKSDEIELAGSKRKPTSSHSLSSSQLSQTHSRHSTKSTPRNDAVAQSSSSSSSSSRSTSAKSSALEPSQESNQVTTPTTTTTTTATSAAAINTRLKEDQEATQNEEANERTLIETDEDAGRRGITWAAKSQYTVLLQRRTAEEKEESTIPGRGTFSLNTYMARAHQRQQEAENIMITRDSDDDDDDSDILFCRKGSSDESF